MERYEAYKDSGVEWIGEIPEGWEVARLNSLCTMSGGATPSKDRLEYWDGDIPWVSSQEVKSSHLCDTSLHVTRDAIDSCSTDVYPAGCVVAVVRSGILKHTLPVAMLDVPMSINQDVKAICFESGITARFFLHYVSGLNDFLLRYLTKEGATVDNLDVYLFARCPITLPRLEEQQAIADYLDARTTEIDALVADCEREVELLREYRKAVISEAVTKGLDPNVPMKDSGVEWIGEIPKDWYCAKLGLISVSTLGRMLDTEKQTGDCLAPYLSNRDVQWFRIDDSDLKEMDFPYEVRSSYEIRDGDMLVCEGGEVGRSTVWHGPTPSFYFQKAIHRVRFDNSVIDPDFAVYQMFQKAQVTMFREVRKGESTIGHLPGDQLRQLTFVVPPLEQQRAIVAYLDAKTAEIDALIDAKQSMADKLREYRRSLISEAVTGKFKVPGV